MQISTDIFELIKPDGGKFRVNNLEEAYIFCKKIATSHYENFPVGSVFIPKRSRKHFYSVYSFARLADDIADETTDKEKAIEALEILEEFLTLNKLKEGNPILMALGNTNKLLNIPLLPYKKLLKAFRMDLDFSQPQSLEDLEYYCDNSANPIGELVLRIFGNYKVDTKTYSDDICTALQLVNFWQDISRDKQKGRIYIPNDLIKKYKLNNENLAIEKNSSKLNLLLDEIFDFTEKKFSNGEKLIELLRSRKLRAEIKFVIEGGKLILKKCKKLNTKLIHQRPKLSKGDFAVLFLKVLFTK